MTSDQVESAERGRSRHGFGAVLAVVLVTVALSVGGLVTAANLTDDERVHVSMAAADRFSIESLTDADHLLDLRAATGDEWQGLDSGSIEWRIVSDRPNRQSIVIAATTPENRTFVVSEPALLATVGATSLGDVSLTLDDGTALRFTRRTANGSDWLVFTIGHFSTRTIHLETEPALGNASGGNSTFGALSTTPTNNTSVENGTVADPPTLNGTDENSTAGPSNSTSADPFDPTSSGNVTSAPSTNETVESLNGTQPSGNETDEGLASADSTNQTTEETDPAPANETDSAADGSLTDGTADPTQTTNATAETSGSSPETNTTDETTDSTTNTTSDGTDPSTTDSTNTTADGSPDTTDTSTGDGTDDGADNGTDDGAEDGATDDSSADPTSDGTTDETTPADDTTEEPVSTDDQTGDGSVTGDN